MRVNGEEGPLGDIPIQAEYSDGWETQRISEERGVKGSFEARTLRELEKSKTPPRYSVGTESLRSPDRSNHFSYSPMRPHQNGNGAPQTDNNGEFALPEEAPEWVEKIFNEHIQNNQMWKDIDRDSNEKWQQIQNNSEKMTLWISKKDARRHRGKFAFKNTSVQKVVKVIFYNHEDLS